MYIFLWQHIKYIWLSLLINNAHMYIWCIYFYMYFLVKRKWADNQRLFWDHMGMMVSKNVRQPITEQYGNMWSMMSKISAFMYVASSGFQCWPTSGSAGRRGWSWQPITGLLLNTWSKTVLGNNLQPMTGQYENLLVTTFYEIVSPCHEMVDNSKWWPPCM